MVNERDKNEQSKHWESRELMGLIDKMRKTQPQVLTRMVVFKQKNILIEYKELTEHLDSWVKNESKTLITRYTKMIDSSMTEEEQEAISEEYNDEQNKMDFSFKRQISVNSIVSLYSLFESSLRTICVYIDRFNLFKIKPDDLAGNNHILKYVNYLEKVVELDLSQGELILKEINVIQQVRNVLVHEGMDLFTQKRKDQITTIKSSYAGISLDGNTILIEPEFYNTFQNKMIEYLDVVNDSIKLSTKLIRA